SRCDLFAPWAPIFSAAISSRGYAYAVAVERAPHFLFNPLHGASADANQAGDLQDARTLLQMTQDSFLYRRGYPRAAELRALFCGPLTPCFASLGDQGPPNPGKGAVTLKHQFPRRRRRVDRLLLEEQINATSFEPLNGAEKVNQRPSKPVNR